MRKYQLIIHFCGTRKNHDIMIICSCIEEVVDCLQSQLIYDKIHFNDVDWQYTINTIN